jgi:hypothetical protein
VQIKTIELEGQAKGASSLLSLNATIDQVGIDKNYK